MRKLHNDPHIIRNFPKNYPLIKKIGCNLTFFFAGIVLRPRENLLTKRDIKKAKKILRKGDVILIGNLRTMFASILNDPITHTALYIGGKKKIIHAMADGVHFMGRQAMFSMYDTMIILRIPKIKGRRKIIKDVKEYAIKQWKKPYDYGFKRNSKSFFCSELVNKAYRKAGYDTGLKTFTDKNDLLSRMTKKVHGGLEALRPKDFIEGNFEIVFKSHNLKFKNKKLIFVNKKIKKYSA